MLTRWQTSRVIVTSTDEDNSLYGISTVEDRQGFQLTQDRINAMFAMLDSTLETIATLNEYYHIFVLGYDGIRPSIARSDPIAFAFHQKEREVGFLRKKLESLHKRVGATVQLLSSILDLENGLSLRKLAEESRSENQALHALTKKATQDAAAVKVITIITMIYLPASVVATFFSTVFVSSTPHGVGVKDNWWIFFAVSLPLTVGTFSLWLVLYQHELCLGQLKRWKTRAVQRLEKVRGLQHEPTSPSGESGHRAMTPTPDTRTIIL